MMGHVLPEQVEKHVEDSPSPQANAEMAGMGSSIQPVPIPYRQVESIEMRMEALPELMQSDPVTMDAAQFDTNPAAP